MQPEARPVLEKILGSNNILLIVPHGHRQEAGHMADLGRSLARSLHCYGLVNGKYKRAILDLADTRAILKRKKVADEFLGTIRNFRDEIIGNDLLPLVLIMATGTPDQVPANTLVFGYGQGERGNRDRPHRPTLSPSLLSRIRMAVEDQGMKTMVADTASGLCGNEDNSLNQVFRRRNDLPQLHDPTVRSLLVTLAPDLVASRERAGQTASDLLHALRPLASDMSLVRRVELDNIDTMTRRDTRFIFRVREEEQYTDMLREAYLEELASSIAGNGLLHPLVLLQKNDGRYKILCGFRRFQAIRRLGWRWVEAKVYHENDFTTEDLFNISLAENTRRRNLNPVEIGNFLESAAREMGLNNQELAERFGASLGIGRPGQKVSQSTIHKYRKVNMIRERGESAEIITDLIDEKLSFTIVAEILAPIRNPADRDLLYLQIIRPLAPTRPQLLQIVKLLPAIGSSIAAAIANPAVRQALARARSARSPAAAFVQELQRLDTGSLPRRKARLEEKVTGLRSTFFGTKASKRDFNITAPARMDRQELTLHVRLKGDRVEETIQRLQQLLADREQLAGLMEILKE
ncbi:MAG TPA: ParB/RepB/Spo0J family partition protein [Desulfobulbus sp.]|nr:ParB/RepB/Spo0J family partition protein [Desulfobulbus sp.]